MLTLIQNGYVRQSVLGDELASEVDLTGVSLGTGGVLFTYSTFLGFGTGYDSWYGNIRTHAVAATLAVDGYTAGTVVDLTHRRIKTPLLASDGDTGALTLYEATSSGSAGVGAGYQLLSVAGTAVTEGTTDPITGSADYTFTTGSTAVLPGTSIFFVQRAHDQNAQPSVYTSPTVSLDKVTITSGVPSHVAIASGLTGRMDLRGVLPIDATTAYAAAGPWNLTGDSPANTGLRMYRLSTTDSMVTTDLTFAVLGYAPIYAGTTSAYPVEVFGQITSGPDAGDLTRYGISYAGGFTAELMPLDQIDADAAPPGMTGTFSTSLTDAQYVPVGDQLYVVRVVSDYSSADNDTYLRITQYHGASGVVVGETWTVAPDPASGMQRYSSTYVTAFYDASLNQLVVAHAEIEQQTDPPFDAINGIRMATFRVVASVPPLRARQRRLQSSSHAAQATSNPLTFRAKGDY